MDCSWSTLANPLNLMRAMWDLAVYCWRSLEVFCARMTRSRRAPTVENIVAFDNQPTVTGMRRDYSLQVHQGSVESSSMQDSTISERSPGIDAFIVPETPSQTSRPPSGEQNVPERMPRTGQTDHDALLHRRERPRSLERPVFTFEGTPSSVPASSEKSYKTFEKSI